MAVSVGERRRTGSAAAARESRDSGHGFPVLVRPLEMLSDDQFYEFCRLNDELLLSPTDTLSRTQAKMREYLANGLALGWLIDPFARRVYVYRRGAALEVLDDPEAVDGAPVLPGFRLDLRRVWGDSDE